MVVSRPSMTVEEEVLLHDRDSFLADLGGYVGILLGVSCWSLYDIAVGFIKRKFK